MFKEIKQRLLDQNKIVAYLGYAAGEVILIVIGILIAVSIDNWNEEREQKKVLDGIFAVLMNDLKQDTLEVNKILDFYSERGATFLKVTAGVLTDDEVSGCDLCPSLLSDRKLFVINQRGFYQLSEFKNDILGSQDSLAFDIANFYTTLVDDVESFNDLINDDVMGNLIYLRDKYAWFPSLIAGKLEKEDLLYFKSSDYRNRVLLHYVLIYKNYLPILRAFQKDARIILTELQGRLHESK